jgi:hypothetical protein
MIRIFDKTSGESIELDVSVEFARLSIERYIQYLHKNREYNKKRYVPTGKPAGRPRKNLEVLPEPEPEQEVPVRKSGRPRKYEFTVEVK